MPPDATAESRLTAAFPADQDAAREPLAALSNQLLLGVRDVNTHLGSCGVRAPLPSPLLRQMPMHPEC